MTTPSLFGADLIERLTGVVDAQLVPVPNGSEARWARDSSGRQWVRKRESDTGFQPLLAEAVGYLLGKDLGVRQPEGAVYLEGAEWSWMSERLVAAGEHWSADLRDLISNPDEVARMLVLDALLLNEDRHRRNILVEPENDDAHLRLWAIDSGNALIGQPADFLEAGRRAPSPYNHARGLPIEMLSDGAFAAAQVALALPAERLVAIVGEACALVREPQEAAISNALIDRCRHAPEIVASYLDALGEMT